MHNLKLILVCSVIFACAALGGPLAGGAVAATSTCAASQLTASLNAGSPGAGQRYATLSLRNRSARACALSGYARLGLVGAHGRRLATHVVHERAAKPGRVSLAPGQSASSLLHWSVIPGRGEPQTARCEPVPSSIAVTAPGAGRSLMIAWHFGPVCEHGQITLTPVARGSGRHPVAKRARSLLELSTAKRTRGNILLGWRVRTDLASAVVRLNGQRVKTSLPLFRGQRTIVTLDPADGLRFGRNVIVVRVRPRAGGVRTRTLRRIVRVRADAPLPAIVQPARAVTGQSVTIDGRRTRAAHKGKLTVHWRIVRAPRGAHATLTGAGTLRPHLKATVPGDYRLALTAIEPGALRHRRGARAASAPCAVSGATPPGISEDEQPSAPTTQVPAASAPLPATIPALPLLPADASEVPSLTVVGSASATAAGPSARAESGCATDVESVDVMPNTTPMGVAFDSHASYEGQTGIRIGTSFYPLPGLGGGSRIVLLDARNLEPLKTYVDNSTISAQGLGELYAFPYQAEGRNVLIVAAGVGGCCTRDSSDSSSGFTLVENYAPGSHGTPAENQGLTLGEGNGSTEAPGEMSGWLTPGIPLHGGEALYSFVSPERIPFSTQASGSSDVSNTMVLGERSYQSTLPTGADAGFQVLVTNSELEPILGTPIAFATDSSTPSVSEAQERAMTSLLVSAVSQPGATLFLQSINNPTPSSPVASSLGTVLGLFGASQWMYLSLDGSGNYAFVGNPNDQALGLDATAAETSSQWTNAESAEPQASAGGSLQGLLRRRTDSSLAPMVAGSIGTPDFGLEQVTYQAPIAWPQTETAGKIAATRWLAEKLGLQPGPGSCYQPEAPDFRSSYCNSAIEPVALKDELASESYPSGNTEFTRQEFTEVQQELETELLDVAQVRALVAALRIPLQEVNPAVEASAIAGKIISAIPPPSTSATSAELSLAASILDAGTELPVAGSALDTISSVLDIASQLTQEGGAPSPDWSIQTAADNIGATVQERLGQMTGSLGSIEDILVSDWGKLSTAARDAKSTWGISASGVQATKSTIELGIRQWMWTAIAPAAFQLVALPGAPEEAHEDVFCVVRISDDWKPWKSASAESLLYPLNTFEGGKAVSNIAFGLLSGSVTNRSSEAVSPELAQAMFGRPPSGAGLVAPWLLERGKWRFERPRMIVEEEEIEHRGTCGFEYDT